MFIFRDLFSLFLIYIMSEKATGNDWKKRKEKWTLRHAAGDKKNLK